MAQFGPLTCFRGPKGPCRSGGPVLWSVAMRSTRSTIWRALLIATAVALTTMPIARVGALGSPTSSRAPKAAHPRALVARSDFNGDGYSDVAIGVPQESVGAVSTAGA